MSLIVVEIKVIYQFVSKGFVIEIVCQYLTSDGGMNLPTLYAMVDLLEEHVTVVNHEELTEMARQKSAL